MGVTHVFHGVTIFQCINAAIKREQWCLHQLQSVSSIASFQDAKIQNFKAVCKVLARKIALKNIWILPFNSRFIFEGVSVSALTPCWHYFSRVKVGLTQG